MDFIENVLGKIPFVGDIIQGVGSYFGQKRANEANSALSAQQMDFQRDMSNTAHQREIKDLAAAGLNPILSGTGGHGSSTPSGSMARMENALGPAISTAMAARKQRAEVALIESQREKTYDEQTGVRENNQILREQFDLHQKANKVRANDVATSNMELELLRKEMPGLLDAAGLSSGTAASIKRRTDMASEGFGNVMKALNPFGGLFSGRSAERINKTTGEITNPKRIRRDWYSTNPAR